MLKIDDLGMRSSLCFHGCHQKNLHFSSKTCDNFQSNLKTQVRQWSGGFHEILKTSILRRTLTAHGILYGVFWPIKIIQKPLYHCLTYNLMYISSLVHTIIKSSRSLQTMRTRLELAWDRATNMYHVSNHFPTVTTNKLSPTGSPSQNFLKSWRNVVLGEKFLTRTKLSYSTHTLEDQKGNHSSSFSHLKSKLQRAPESLFRNNSCVCGCPITLQQLL